MAIATIITVLLFFYVYLPNYTNHGETIHVPNFIGLQLEEIKELAADKALRFEVTSDSSYSSDHKPLTVLQQHPIAGSMVKENRKIYISVNAKFPPEIKMPNLIDGSLKNALIMLKSFGLEMEEPNYVPDLAFNAVIQQYYNGEEIEPGTAIRKGSKIKLDIGNGHGNRKFRSPNVIGMDLETAEFVILGSGLRIGNTQYEITTDVEHGTIISQIPEANKIIRIGDHIHMIVAKFEEGAIIKHANQEETPAP